MVSAVTGVTGDGSDLPPLRKYRSNKNKNKLRYFLKRPDTPDTTSNIEIIIIYTINIVTIYAVYYFFI
jgi:hypothetical protein